MANQTNLPVKYESDENILRAAQEDAGFEKLLKFKKGKYFIGEAEVPLGSEFVAHTPQWTKCWIKFAGGKVADRRIYKVAEGFKPPPRENLGDNDESAWEAGLDGKPKNPWSLQDLLPLENFENGEIIIFTTSSTGGGIAVAELCQAYVRHAQRASRALPLVKLSVADMPTKLYGDVPRPHFEISGWDEATAGGIEVITPNAASELNDEIPF
jgi:hypothetical protein